MTVTEAKAQLSRLLERVLSGERIAIGRRGRPEVVLQAYEADEGPRPLGKLTVDGDVREHIARSRFTSLPITFDHAAAVEDLPALHRDPFDRMLVAQAQIEQATLVTRDAAVQGYDIATITAGATASGCPAVGCWPTVRQCLDNL